MHPLREHCAFLRLPGSHARGGCPLRFRLCGPKALLRAPLMRTLGKKECSSFTTAYFPSLGHSSAAPTQTKGIKMEHSSTYQPQVIRETSEGIQYLDVRDEMLRSRELELCGPVDADSASCIIRNLLFLQKENADGAITLFINSPGGEVQSGLAVYDVMQAISCPIRTVCLGMAASMAALLFIAGNQRDMLPHSRVMVHDPLIGGGIGGSALSVKARADDLMRIRDITAQIMAKHSGMNMEEVFELTAKDTYFEAEEAVEAGLADRIVSTL